jgi:hypothetical protein
MKKSGGPSTEPAAKSRMGLSFIEKTGPYNETYDTLFRELL